MVQTKKPKKTFVWLFCYYFTAYNGVTWLKIVYFLRSLTTQQFRALLVTKDFSSYKFVHLLFYCYWFQGIKIYNFCGTHMHTFMQHGDLVSLLSVFLWERKLGWKYFNAMYLKQNTNTMQQYRWFFIVVSLLLISCAHSRIIIMLNGNVNH